MKKRVLIIEDDRAIREILTIILTSEGYEVFQAVNGQEGLDKLRQGLKPHVILLDLMMPIKDGFAFRAEQLGSPEYSDIPVIIMSANGNLAEKFTSMGENLPFLKKPPDLNRLISTVHEHAQAAMAR